MRRRLALAALLLAGAAGCGGDGDGPGSGGARAANGGPGGFSGSGGPPGGGSPAAAVPVEVRPVERRAISSYIETNGTLEAENEVDVVARAGGPIVELAAEEGDRVRKGDLLARVDELEYRAQVEIARVLVDEAQHAFERAERLVGENLISPESYEQALSDYETAQAQLEASRILLGFTEVRAPFDGLIINRYVDLAQTVATNASVFRISDFDPLLCPIQVPERELRRLRLNQRAYLTVESWPDERFAARVLRIRPVVDAATGTVRVTLEVDDAGRLRPGMFARVFVETETKPNALVIPKAALSLESIGDTVYVADGGTASRREVALGFREGDFVEVLSGVAENEPVVVIGQDGLSEGTPIHILAAAGGAPSPPPSAGEMAQRGETAAGPRGPAAGKGRRNIDLSSMSPEQLERAKQFMRARGMTDEQIEERIRRSRESAGTGGE